MTIFAKCHWKKGYDSGPVFYSEIFLTVDGSWLLITTNPDMIRDAVQGQMEGTGPESPLIRRFLNASNMVL